MNMRQLANLSMAIVALAACKNEGVATRALPPATPKPTVVAIAADAPDVITITGTIAADQTSQVSASVGGKVLALLVRRGQRVKAGDVLARLDARQQALGALEAQANLAMVEAQRLQADDECRRAEQLFSQGAITKSQYEREAVACKAAAQSVRAAAARTRAVGKQVSDGTVRAPFDGVIAETWVNPGEVVGPGMRLVTLLDDSPLKVEMAVSESVVARLKEGQAVSVTTIGQHGERAATGRIARLGPEISRMTRALTAEATLDGANGLLPGMFVECTVHVGTVSRPTVPETSIIKKGQTWRAFIVRDGFLEERVIQRGLGATPGMVAVTRGLAVGDEVVSAIDESVVDGLRIK